MATRSYIGVKNTDGTVDYIYCHWDGYPEYVGKILANHYQDMDRVNELIKLGDLSCLGKEIGEKHEFNKSVPGWCKAYGRDREDHKVNGNLAISATTTTFDKLISYGGNVDYIYIFDGEFWDCYDTYYRTSINLYNELDVEVNKK